MLILSQNGCDPRNDPSSSGNCKPRKQLQTLIVYIFLQLCSDSNGEEEFQTDIIICQTSVSSFVYALLSSEKEKCHNKKGTTEPIFMNNV